MNDIKISYIIFFSLTIKFAYLFVSYFLNIDFTTCCDYSRYDDLSNLILTQNYNFNHGAFVVAPIFPLVLSFAKIISFLNHIFVIQIFQIFISTISVYFLIKITDLIFQDRVITILSGFLFSIYPFTFWFSIYVGQETFFQSFWIISVFYFLKFIKLKGYKDIILFSIFFSLTILTKSHIIIFAPFVFFIIFIKLPNLIHTIKSSFIFIFILTLFILPQSLNNKYKNGFHVFSTSGGGFHFLVGHNDEFYDFVVNRDSLDADQYKKIKSMDFEVIKKISLNNKKKNNSELDKIYFENGLNWIVKNKEKALKLFLINLKNFLQPGFNKDHHPYYKWLISFIISVPIFFFGYLGIIISLKKNFRNHLFIASIFLTMFLFSVIFYTQNRFRVITIEPFYIIYASFCIIMFKKFIHNYLKKIKKTF